MIRYGIKLWSSNSRDMFADVARVIASRQMDFVELYHNPSAPFDEKKFSLLRSVPVTIHAPNSGNWHEFLIGDAERECWRETIAMADFLKSLYIVVHPGRTHTFETFSEQLKKIDDPRILIENMAGLDIHDQPMFGQTLEDLRAIAKQKHICFDIEKAIKAACYQYKERNSFLAECVAKLRPTYFHISGGDKDSARDEHLNLWDANFDFPFIGKLLAGVAKTSDIMLVFETPKEGDSLDNDLKNRAYLERFIVGG